LGVGNGERSYKRSLGKNQNRVRGGEGLWKTSKGLSPSKGGDLTKKKGGGGKREEYPHSAKEKTNEKGKGLQWYYGIITIRSEGRA